MTKPKRKPRGVVSERFATGESIASIAVSRRPAARYDMYAFAVECTKVEAILRRALKKKVGK